MKAIKPLFILIVLTASCKKDNEKIRLIYPADHDIVNPCCVNFMWETDLSGEVNLEISADKTFLNPLVDTVIAAKAFLLEQNLQPDVEYYWRISQGSEMAMTSFRIKDVLSWFEGDVFVEIHKSAWGALCCTDTTFIDTVNLFVDGLSIRFRYQDDNIDKLLSFNQYGSGQPNKVFYLYPSLHSTRCIITLDYSTDSIFIENANGGLGGGTTWVMKGKK